MTLKLKRAKSMTPHVGKAHLKRLARTKDAKFLEEKVRRMRQRVYPRFSMAPLTLFSAPPQMKQLFRKYDANKDRRLDHAELRGMLTRVFCLQRARICNLRWIHRSGISGIGGSDLSGHL